MKRRHAYEDFRREKNAAMCWLLLFVLLVVGAVQDKPGKPVVTTDAIALR